MKMTLEVEGRKPVYTSSFRQVEKSLRRLRSYGPNSFANLTKEDGSYLQIAGGGVTCVLEMHEMPGGKHWRAYLDKPKVPFEGQQKMMFGGGEITMEADEILFIDDAITIFKCFFDETMDLCGVGWRDMSHLLEK